MTSSWVIREIATQKVICETYDIRKVNALNTAKYEAVPIVQYLASLNAVIKLMLSTPGEVKGRAIAEHLINEIEGTS